MTRTLKLEYDVSFTETSDLENITASGKESYILLQACSTQTGCQFAMALSQGTFSLFAEMIHRAI